MTLTLNQPPPKWPILCRVGRYTLLQPTARYDHDRTQTDNQCQRSVSSKDWVDTDGRTRPIATILTMHLNMITLYCSRVVHGFILCEPRTHTHTPGSRNTRGPQEDSEKHLTYNPNESQARTTSQTGIVLKRLDESSSFLARRLPSTIPYCVKRKFRYLQ